MELKPQLLKNARQLLETGQSSYLKGLSHLKSFLTSRLSCCDLCGSPCQQYALLCHTCTGDLPVFKTADIRGDLLNWPAVHRALPKVCFDHLVSLSPYQWPLSVWLKQLKYQGRFELATLLGQLLADHWQKQIKPYLEQEPGLVLSVPLHFSKWQFRGYNQAHLIAKTFAKKTGYSYQATALTRERKTSAQVGQGGIARRKNLRQAFTVNAKLLPQHILLMDDVITTGSTVNEISRLLKKQGVVKVTVVSACLTLPG
ncbi:ComF family protein [Thalassomonas sp. RHCl1]|uniref:ComF family protein n=1 Tax=Thalassomonas sp. RHCl1 TaxID=2995320 RepID=UPI00248D173C|nr:ComF family protein [Thalassomonas sp. RHCl1]